MFVYDVHRYSVFYGKSGLESIFDATYIFQLSSLEILAESLVGEMEEKEREHSRAKSARAEYAKDAEEAQAWLQKAETRVQDRTGPRPHDVRARLQEVGEK